MTGDVVEAIADELLLAFRKLSATPGKLAGIDWNDNDAVIAAAQEHHADFELLCATGSRGDTLSDDEVLRYLQAINARGARYSRG